MRAYTSSLSSCICSLHGFGIIKFHIKIIYVLVYIFFFFLQSLLLLFAMPLQIIIMKKKKHKKILQVKPLAFKCFGNKKIQRVDCNITSSSSAGKQFQDENIQRFIILFLAMYQLYNSLNVVSKKCCAIKKLKKKDELMIPTRNWND